jgi:hypothetical protein
VQRRRFVLQPALAQETFEGALEGG